MRYGQGRLSLSTSRACNRLADRVQELERSRLSRLRRSLSREDAAGRIVCIVVQSDELRSLGEHTSGSASAPSSQGGGPFPRNQDASAQAGVRGSLPRDRRSGEPRRTTATASRCPHAFEAPQNRKALEDLLLEPVGASGFEPPTPRPPVSDPARRSPTVEDIAGTLEDARGPSRHVQPHGAAASVDDELRALVSELRAVVADLRAENRRLRQELGERSAEVVHLAARKKQR